MKYRIISQKAGYTRNMWSPEMMETLGLKPGGHLPKEGMPEREIQGIRVYVKPANEPIIGKYYTHRNTKHRVIAICPGCNRHLSAGRLHQHVCKGAK